MDWFVVLTPFWLLPILGLFAFIGCSLIFDEAPADPPDLPDPPVFTDIAVKVKFFPRSIGSNSGEFRVVVSGLTPNNIETQRPPDSLTPPPEREATYLLKTEDDAETFQAITGEELVISCQVFEPGSDTPLVASIDPPCKPTLVADTTYEIEFSAPEDETFFDDCTLTVTL